MATEDELASGTAAVLVVKAIGLPSLSTSGGVVHVPAFGESRGSCSISTPQ